MLTWVCEVLKQVHSDSGISNKAMPRPRLDRQRHLGVYRLRGLQSVFSSCERLTLRSPRIAQSSRQTANVVTSVRLILPGELSEHAISEGTKSVTNFSSAGKYLHLPAPDSLTSVTCDVTLSTPTCSKSGRVRCLCSQW